jgi:hypothetical protein
VKAAKVLSLLPPSKLLQPLHQALKQRKVEKAAKVEKAEKVKAISRPKNPPKRVVRTLLPQPALGIFLTELKTHARLGLKSECCVGYAHATFTLKGFLRNPGQ